MSLIENLKSIQRLATQKENENWRFRRYLKGQKSAEIDQIVQRLNREISIKIDCKKCGNCCKSQYPGFNSEEIKVFSNGLNMERSKFVREFLKPSSFKPNIYEFKIESDPCPFFEENLCSNYDYRPKDCRSYPHLDKVGFISRTISVISNTFICPIVYNVVESLKTEIGFS